MQKKSKSTKQQRQEKFNLNVATWCSFWRHNPHRFLIDYLGVPLFIFQQIIIFMMFKSDLILFLASRGLGKKIKKQIEILRVRIFML